MAVIQCMHQINSLPCMRLFIQSILAAQTGDLTQTAYCQVHPEQPYDYPCLEPWIQAYSSFRPCPLASPCTMYELVSKHRLRIQVPCAGLGGWTCLMHRAQHLPSLCPSSSGHTCQSCRSALELSANVTAHVLPALLGLCGLHKAA